MKKILHYLVSLIVIINCCSGIVIASSEINVILDGELIDFDVPAQIIDQRTMVPVRKIFEKLGMTVDWNSDSQKVTAIKKGVFIELTVNDTTAFRNSIEQNIDVPAKIIDGRTLVPIRVVSEYAGAEVSWDAETNTVYINSTNNIQQLAWNDDYEYWGEVKDNEACGYGILYNINDSSIAQMGLYDNSEINKGFSIYEGNEYFFGDFKDGNWDNGTYCYENGDSYIGEFDDFQRHGTGTYFYSDGSFYKGKWKENLPNGYGIFYDAVENVRYEGKYTDGEKDGNFIIEDLLENQTYEATYDNGVYVDENLIQEENLELYNEEYEILIDWAEDKVEEIYDESEKIMSKWYEKHLQAQGYLTMGDIINELKIEQKEYQAKEFEALADFVQDEIEKLKDKYNVEQISYELSSLKTLADIAKKELKELRSQ